MKKVIRKVIRKEMIDVRRNEPKNRMGGGESNLKGLRQFLVEEDGMGTVEIILIIVVLVGLVIIFKNQITQVVNNIFQKITSQTGKV